MPIAVTVTRPKLETTNDFQISVIPSTATTEGNKIFLKVLLDNLEPDPVTFSCSFTSASDSVTFTNNTGKNISTLIRVGDVVSGVGSPFDVGAYVTAVSVVGTAVTLTISDTASSTGTENLTFAVGTVDSTVYILELDHSGSGSNLLVRPALYTFDGTKVADANRDGDDDATINDASSKANLAIQSINIDTYLNNARLQRTNDSV
jgi:hypothetical protein